MGEVPTYLRAGAGYGGAYCGRLTSPALETSVQARLPPLVHAPKPGTGNEQPSSLQPTSITPSLLFLDHIPTKIRVFCCCSRYLRYPFCVCLGFYGSSFTRSTRNLTHSHSLYCFLRILYIVCDDISQALSLAHSVLHLFPILDDRQALLFIIAYLGVDTLPGCHDQSLISDSIKPLARSATVPPLLALLPRNCNFIVPILSLASLTTNSVSHAGFSSRPVTSTLLRTRAPTLSRSPSPVNVRVGLAEDARPVCPV